MTLDVEGIVYGGLNVQEALGEARLVNSATDMTSEIGPLRYCVVYLTTISLQFVIWVLMVKPTPLIDDSVIGD